jgi:hypothetical protein
MAGVSYSRPRNFQLGPGSRRETPATRFRQLTKLFLRVSQSGTEYVQSENLRLRKWGPDWRRIWTPEYLEFGESCDPSQCSSRRRS